MFGLIEAVVERALGMRSEHAIFIVAFSRFDIGRFHKSEKKTLYFATSRDYGSETKDRRKSKGICQEEAAWGQKLYLPECTEKYPILTRYEGSEYRIYCNACKSDFGISHGGKDDCKRHVEGPVHEAKYKTYKSQLSTHIMHAIG